MVNFIIELVLISLMIVLIRFFIIRIKTQRFNFYTIPNYIMVVALSLR